MTHALFSLFEEATHQVRGTADTSFHQGSRPRLLGRAA